ncbi:hypothetical protein SprV_0501800500 [Sparganum proliferum]
MEPAQTTAPVGSLASETCMREFKRMLEENCERISQEEAHLEDLLNRSRTIERDAQSFTKMPATSGRSGSFMRLLEVFCLCSRPCSREGQSASFQRF